MAGESLRRPRHSERFDGRSEWTEAVMQARRCGLAATFALALPVALGAGAPASAAPVAGPLFRDPGGACVRTPPTIPTGARTRLSDVLGGAFVENRGQVAAPVEFYLPVGRDRVWVAPRELVFDQSSRRRGGRVERLRFTQRLVGARTGRVEGRRSLPGQANFVRPGRPGVSASRFGEVVQNDAWRGIDVRLRVRGGALEQDFLVRPGADRRHVRVAYRGIRGLRVARDGSLQIRTAFGVLRERAPVAYQVIDGRRHSSVRGSASSADAPTPSRSRTTAAIGPS